MPDPNSFWIVAFRPDSDDSVTDLTDRLNSLSTVGSSTSVRLLQITTPEFKTPPLSTLISLSEILAKHEPIANQTLLKILDTLQSLSASKPTSLIRNTPSTSGSGSGSTSSRALDENLMMDDGRGYEDYLLKNWEWNRVKYNRVDSRKLEDLVESLTREVNAIDNSHKLKLATYNQAKAQLSAAQRKRTGNLSVRSLNDVVTRDHFVDHESEYLQTLIVAVSNTQIKEWMNSYESLTTLVVPRSSNKISSDEEYTLFNVVILKKARENFIQKCRERKFIVRDFVFDESEIEKSRQESKELEQQEKELWSELLRLSRINFSETFQAIVHLKVIQTHIESLLRFGLPAHFLTLILKPEPRTSKKILNQLIAYQDSLESSVLQKRHPKPKQSTETDDLIGGEYASVLEKEVFEFVLFEIIDPRREGKGNGP
ncbi:hypothetical protein CROQUDRAFT_662082 [Cronartium quercuum f. sp. fusiforme G11]|uniref:V-type proton ATPase subunit C n=1 Tax=Cronartium quercuum f. sp. fusiforme G11 TaxID=708437 RepID=A0A9P6T9P6_9BASI|nr:hypothetical protein CROQUDRAFT_662082 [Cronartium quercuum f. sp. fusiforme G11]